MTKPRKNRRQTCNLINSGIISPAIDKLSVSYRKYATAFISPSVARKSALPLPKRWNDFKKLSGEKIRSVFCSYNAYRCSKGVHANDVYWIACPFKNALRKFALHYLCTMMIDRLLHYLFVRVTDRIRIFSRLSLAGRQFFRFSTAINRETSMFDEKTQKEKRNDNKQACWEPWVDTTMSRVPVEQTISRN